MGKGPCLQPALGADRRACHSPTYGTSGWANAARVVIATMQRPAEFFSPESCICNSRVIRCCDIASHQCVSPLTYFRQTEATKKTQSIDQNNSQTSIITCNISDLRNIVGLSVAALVSTSRF